MRVTSTSWRRRSAWVPKRPPKPEPMTTTLWGVVTTGATRATSLVCRGAGEVEVLTRCGWAVRTHPVRMMPLRPGSGWLDGTLPDVAGGHHVSLAGVLRITGAPRGPDLQTGELAGRAEQALADGGHDDERRRLRRRLVRRLRDTGPVPQHRARVERHQPA